MQELSPDVVLTLLMFMEEKARKRNKEISIVKTLHKEQATSMLYMQQLNKKDLFHLII